METSGSGDAHVTPQLQMAELVMAKPSDGATI
jgi:hypothetical protein